MLPRVGTLRDPDCPTYGDQVGDVARRLGTPLMPWQQYAADVAYEINPDTGRLKYDEVVLTIMRQSGKTTLVRAKKIWRLTVVPHRLGPQVAMYTAQTRAAARRKLERDFMGALRTAEERSSSFLEIRNPRARPSNSTRQWRGSLNNGMEHILFGCGNYLQIEAPNREAGHGDTLDDCTLDEAFALMSDDVEQAARPAMATRPDAQLWPVSTAGDEKSFYLWPKIVAGRSIVEKGLPSSTCYLEWSLPADAEIDDEDAWWEFMPALGRTIDVEFLRAELKRARNRADDDGEDLFRRGYCNQWVRVPAVSSAGVEEIISESSLTAASRPKSTEIVGQVVVGVAVSPDGAAAAVAVAGENAAGEVQVEVTNFDPGTFWLEERLRSVRERHAAVAVTYRAQGWASVLAPEIIRAAGPVDVEPLTGVRWSSACQAFALGMQNQRIVHVDQPWLTTAIAGARKKWRGESWIWDPLTSLADVAPLEAATAAVSTLSNRGPGFRSAYEDFEL